MPAMFRVRRACRDGECPHIERGCDCSEPVVDLDVDELSEEELVFFAQRGTPNQVALIAAWLRGDPEGELLAGRPDGAPLPGTSGAAA